MDALLAAAIAAAAVLVSQLIAALAPRWHLTSDVAREDSIESSRRRREVYEGFVEAIFGQLDSSKDGAGHLNPRAEKELLRVFRTFRTRVLLVGSDEVVRSFNDWNLYSERNSTVEDAQDMLAAMADLVVAIRKDLGYPRSALKRIEILAVFLTDAEEQEGAMAKPRARRFENTRSL